MFSNYRVLQKIPEIQKMARNERRKNLGKYTNNNGFLDKLNKVTFDKVGSHGKRGRPTLEQAIEHKTISECWDYIDNYVSLCAQVVDEYKKFKKGGKKQDSEIVMRLFKFLKHNSTMTRHHMTFIIRDCEKVFFRNISHFKTLVGRGEKDKAKALALKAGFDYDSYSDLKFHKQKIT